MNRSPCPGEMAWTSRRLVEGLARSEMGSRRIGNRHTPRRVSSSKEMAMATKPPQPKVPPRKPPQLPKSDERPVLPHDLPMFPENAPLDDQGEPIVRP